MKRLQDSGTLPQMDMRNRSAVSARETVREHTIDVSLLTGGDDRSYALGLTCALAARGVSVDFVGSDKLDAPELHGNRLIRFLNLRGDQAEDAPLRTKVRRLLRYYLRLTAYAARARPRIFHILWNNKFEFFDRTALMLYYRLCGLKVVLTAHNVNAARRDSRDSMLNRITLWIQYHLARHTFVHTQKMKEELSDDFGVDRSRISVIPFGINDTSPRTDLTCAEAKKRLGLESDELALLFFGQIAPYKGLEYLVEALADLATRVPRTRLIIAGKVKRGSEDYWRGVEQLLADRGLVEHTISRVEHIPDSEVELYFKGADVLVVPYVEIFQSGVPFLAYSFGLPVIVTDVGSLREDVIEGETGLVCAPRNASELAGAIERYWRSELYRELEDARSRIMNIARERHSWEKVAQITRAVYASLLDGK
jgi:D-inositol-3-phosphate glycosyltransferase